jgi:hypothetical protein
MPIEPVRSLWIGNPLPSAQRACIESFLSVGHPFELFVYELIDNLPPGVRIRPADEIVPRSRIFRYSAAAGPGQGGLGGFSNLFRYTLLLREGGYWVDTDNFCLRPFPGDPLVISSERLRDGRAVPNCGVIKCPPGHALARYCLHHAQAADIHTLQFSQIGPSLMAAAVAELGLHDAVTDPEIFCAIPWFEFESLRDPPPPALPASALGLHLWGECWRRVGGDIPWPGAGGSLLRQLADRASSSPVNASPTPIA